MNINRTSLAQYVLAATAVAWLALGPSSAFAQLEAEPLPGDPKLVEFSYDPNNSFRVFTRPMASTYIQLDPDERVRVLAMGDTTSWITAHRDNAVFIKPKYANITTSATLITTKRDYQFVFRSTTENGRWYQRVTFQDPSRWIIEGSDSDRSQLATYGNDPVPSAQQSSTKEPGAVRPEQLNFDYDIKGDESLRPSSVYDNGVFTYIQLRSDQDVPAVFRLIDNEIELVEFTIKGTALVVPRVLEGGLLKLGNKEVRFYNKQKQTGNKTSNFFKDLFR